MSGQFHVQTERRGTAIVIAARGELDLATGPELEAELSALAPPETTTVVVDLRELEFMDSTGLSIIVRAHQRLQQAGCALGVAQGSAQVQRLLDLTGVAERLRLVDTPEEMLDGR